MHRSEPSRLQSLALQLADKINNFVDSNERILETKQGNFFLRGGPNQVKVKCLKLPLYHVLICCCYRAISEATDKTTEEATRRIGTGKGGIAKNTQINLINIILYLYCRLIGLALYSPPVLSICDLRVGFYCFSITSIKSSY